MSRDQKLKFLLFGLNVAFALEHKRLGHNVSVQCSLELVMWWVAAVCLPMLAIHLQVCFAVVPAAFSRIASSSFAISLTLSRITFSGILVFFNLDSTAKFVH